LTRALRALTVEALEAVSVNHAMYGRRMHESAEEFIARKKDELLTRRVYAKDIGRTGRLVWKREAMTMRPQANYPQKIFIVERLRLVEVEGDRLREGGAQEGHREYRLGYYTVSRTGKWWWGQFAPFIPEDDLWPLLDEARRDGTLLPGDSSPS
jgi:hypothetical protein